MAKLLKKPDTPRDAYVQGVVMAAAAGTPAILIRFVFIRDRFGIWTHIAIAGVLLLLCMILCGAIGAGWAWLQQWAYRRVTTKDDPWDS